MRDVLEPAVCDGSGLGATSGLLVGGQEGAFDVDHALHVLTNDVQVRMSRLKGTKYASHLHYAARSDR